MATHDSISDGTHDFDDAEGEGTLNPNKHPQRDFFIADIVDASLKDDMASMEFPLFALKAGDFKTREYSHNNFHIKITANAEYGLATIHDKDIWIYCISQLVEAMNRGREISRTVRFTAYDFLVSTNRSTSGDSYERFKNAMDRLRSTSITTDIETDGKRESRGFGLLDAWRIVEKDNSDRMVSVEATLPDWLYRSITSMSVVTLSPDYFRIRKPLHRRIYELARKHCGNQPSFNIGLDLLHQKTGSQSNKRLFKEDIKKLSESNDLPDYEIIYPNSEGKVSFKKR